MNFKDQRLMTKPSLEEIDAYCQMKHPTVDPVAFFLHYESNGWMVGKVSMKSWRHAVANWERMGPRFQSRSDERAGRMNREANIGVWRPQ